MDQGPAASTPSPGAPRQPVARPAAIQSPRGTRDFYPADLLRRRYIEKLWRDTAVRHGFEEIDGPTFESRELYERKSGEGILSEMFGVFSGKDDAELAALRDGQPAPYALRPEFTPTLARMYAARARQLPQPTKWFWMQNCYRAERPQRGRLREFGQWNCDILGLPPLPEGPGAADLRTAGVDAELLSVLVACVELAGLTPKDATVRIGDRQTLDAYAEGAKLPPEKYQALHWALDNHSKMDQARLERELAARRVTTDDVNRFFDFLRRADEAAGAPVTDRERYESLGVAWATIERTVTLLARADDLGLGPWRAPDATVVRGLAYYTGMVFELLATGERAVAGGGRYDNLIELFAGPPTPASGFGMGDVVFSLLLEDRGLLPPDDVLLDVLSRPPASYRPDAFVFAGETEGAADAVAPLVAQLRRGRASDAWLSRESRKPWDADRYAVPPLHARQSYKSTRNIGKLLKDAVAARARFAVIVESAQHATIKNLVTQEQAPDVPLAQVGARISVPGPV